MRDMAKSTWPGLLAALLLAACGQFQTAGNGSGVNTGNAITVAGTLARPDGSPAAGARIRVRPEGFVAGDETEAAAKRDTVAGKDGSFELAVPFPGSYLLEAEDGDSLGAAARLRIADSSGARWNAMLARLISVHGSVRDSAGAPLPGAEVRIVGLERKRSADSAGAYTLALPPGGFQILYTPPAGRALAPLRDSLNLGNTRDTVLPPAVLLPYPVPQSGPVDLIVDGDLGVSCQDAAALAVLNRLADAGAIRLLALGYPLGSQDGPPALDAVETYYGRPDVPIGIWKGAGTAETDLYAYALARGPHDLPARDQLPEAAALYRDILATRPDSSVVMLALGPLHDLAQLLDSSRALVAAKVKRLVVMGGAYPNGSEANFRAGMQQGGGYPGATSKALSGWPTPIVFLGSELGDPVRVGRCVEGLPAGHPVRKAFSLALPAKGTCPGSEPLAALLAARGFGALFGEGPHGRNVLEPDGTNAWSEDAAASSTYALPNATASALADSADAWLCGAP
jgi:hypothetical protein